MASLASLQPAHAGSSCHAFVGGETDARRALLPASGRAAGMSASRRNGPERSQRQLCKRLPPCDRPDFAMLIFNLERKRVRIFQTIEFDATQDEFERITLAVELADEINCSRVPECVEDGTHP